MIITILLLIVVILIINAIMSTCYLSKYYFAAVTKAFTVAMLAYKNLLR